MLAMFIELQKIGSRMDRRPKVIRLVNVLDPRVRSEDVAKQGSP